MRLLALPPSLHQGLPSAPLHASRSESALRIKQPAPFSSLPPQQSRSASRDASSSSPSSSSSPPPPAPLLTFAEVQRDALERGMDLKVRTIGPWWEVTLRDRIDGVGSSSSSKSSSSSSSTSSTSSSGAAPSPSSSDLLARAVGVTALGICHLDSLVVSTRRTRGNLGLRTRPGLSGTGGLMAQAVFTSAFESKNNQANKVEVLAVDDGASGEHDRLVRAYRRVAGFEVVKRVFGDKLSDLPDQLVWGAVGSRMDSRIEEQLRRWGAARARGQERKRQKEERGRVVEGFVRND